MPRLCHPIAIATAMLALPCLATFPPGPLDFEQFDYLSDSFLGQDFGFGTEVKFTQSTPDGFPVESTGLQGFTASPSQIAPIPGFESGQEVPLGGQTLADLFPDNPPSQISDTWAENSISGVGDFTQGFTEFSIQQRKVAGVDQDPEGPTDFADAAAVAKAYASFELLGDTPADAMVRIELDSLFNSAGGGFGSEGVAVQLLNVTDLDNPELIYEVEGFYFAEEDSLSASFSMGDDDLSDNFTFDPTGGPDGSSLASFSYSMEMPLDPTMTYGINVISDSSAGASGTGSTSIDSSNTLDVTIQLITPDAQLVIPGASTTGPAPGDANGDGTVDLLDLDILGSNFGSTSASFAEGDFNGDAAVDLLDLDILGANFGSSAASIPEPTAAVVTLVLALATASRTRSPRR